MRSRNAVIALCVAVTAVSVGLAGCASPAKKESMQVETVPVIHQHRKSVSVQTLGGSETTAMDSSNVSNEAFAKAIEESITRTGVFTQVIKDGKSDYILSVNIINISKPVFGASFTVDMEAAWSLVEATSKKIVMRESIKSSHTATMGDAFAAVKRLRLAVEGAAKENIRSGLMAISKLNLE